MTEFIVNLIGNDILATLIMSFVPLIELKGGIVFARGVGFDFFTALGLAYIGSTLVFFPIFFLLKPILNLMKKIRWFNKIAIKVEDYFIEKAEETMQKHAENEKKKSLSETFLKQMGVLIFVAIPLPMTGIWTGTAIAVFLGLSFKQAILPAVLGNLIAGVLMSILSEICLRLWTIEALDYILYALLVIAVIFLIFVIIKIANKKVKNS